MSRFERLRSAIRLSARRWASAPAMACTATVTLAIGVGSTSGIFSITNAIWFRSVPVEALDQVGVVHYRQATPSRDSELLPSVSWQSARSIETLHIFTDVTHEVQPTSPIMEWMSPRVVLEDATEPHTTAIAHNYFTLFGVPLLGRAFLQEEDRADTGVAIVSHSLANRYFEGVAIGRRLQTSRGALTIVGIGPPGFVGPRIGESVDIWIPIGSVPRFTGYPPDMMRLLPVSAFVRLTKGTSWRDAQDEVEKMLGGRVYLQPLARLPFRVASEGALRRQEQLMLVLWVTAGLVLIAACANLASTFFAMAEARRYECAVRLSQGATPRSLVLLALCDGAVLCLVAVPTSLLLSAAVVKILSRYTLPTGLSLAFVADVGLDWRVLAFALIIAVATSLVAALGPCILIFRSNVAQLVSRTRGTGDTAAVRIRQMLLSAHAVVTVVLLAGSASLVGMVLRVKYSEQGLAVAETAFVDVAPSFAVYALAGGDDGAARQEAHFAALVDRIRHLPGVVASTYGDPPLPTARSMLLSVAADSQSVPIPVVAIRGGPGYARTAGAAVIEGRDLESGDLAGPPVPRGASAAVPAVGSAPGALVEETVAKHLWPDGSPIGRSLVLGARRYVIVGVLAEILPGLPYRLSRGTIVAGTEASAAVGQTLPPILVRTRGSAAPHLSTFAEVGRSAFLGAPKVEALSFERILEKVLGNEHIGALFFSWFGIAAAVLGVVGIYGLVSQIVRRTRRELAIRAALGAHPLKLMVRAGARGVLPVIGGAAVGLLGARATLRLASAGIIGLDSLGVDASISATAPLIAAAVVAGACGAAAIRRLSISNELRAE